jgi:hypothetical protein
MRLAPRPTSASDPAAEARTDDQHLDPVDQPGPARRPVRETLEAIERIVGSIRIAPLLLAIGAMWWGQAVLIPIVVSVLVSYALEPAVVAPRRAHYAANKAVCERVDDLQPFAELLSA